MIFGLGGSSRLIDWGGGEGGLNRLFREFLLEENNLLGEFFNSWGAEDPPSRPTSFAYDAILEASFIP